MPVPDRPGVLADVLGLAGEAGINVYDVEIAHSGEGDRGVLILVVAADRSAPFTDRLSERGYKPATRTLG